MGFYVLFFEGGWIWNVTFYALSGTCNVYYHFCCCNNGVCLILIHSEYKEVVDGIFAA